MAWRHRRYHHAWQQCCSEGVLMRAQWEAKWKKEEAEEETASRVESTPH